jgi:beta-lactamase regulating signal transducer with metallopeptidase domain/thiol-disulfide isomerase/thioredoxin
MIHAWLPFVLVNSFWEVCLLGLLTSLLLKVLRNSTANTRYIVWMSCLASCLIVPIASVVFPAAKVVGVASVKTIFVASVDSSANPLNANPLNQVQLGPPGVVRIVSVSNHRLLLGLASLYVLAFVFGVLRLCALAMRTNVLLRTARELVSSPFAEALVRSAMEEHGIDRVELLTTSLEISPATVNWPHSVLILPSSLESSSETELRSVLYHEFAHIKRHDFQFNLLLEVALVLLFFHPVAHFIKKRIDESREAACDEWAATHLRGYKLYAAALLSLAQRARTIPSRLNLSLGITETTHLEKRIMQLLASRSSRSSFQRVCSTGACALGMVAIVGVVTGIGFHPTVRAAVRKIEVKTTPDVLIPAASRKEAPDFSLPDADGKPITLSKCKGKVVLVNFWATWCGGCKLEIPWYIGFDQKYRNKGLQIIGVSMDGDGWKAVRPFLAKRMDDETGGYIAMKYPIVIGSDPLANSFGLTSMPMSILVDKDGKIAVSHAGVVDRTSFEKNIEVLLQ